MTTILTLDPLSVSFTADPHPVLKTLRGCDPVHYLEPFGSWVLTRYDDVRTFFGDPRVKRLFKSDFLFDGPLDVSTSRSPYSRQRLHERKAMTATCAPDAVTRGMTGSVVACTLWVVALELITVVWVLR